MPLGIVQALTTLSSITSKSTLLFCRYLCRGRHLNEPHPNAASGPRRPRVGSHLEYKMMKKTFLAQPLLKVIESRL